MAKHDDLPEELKELTEKPVEPAKHKQRYGVGQITQEKNGLYIATNPLILRNFNIDETVYILSPGSVNHFQDSMMYYMDLHSYQVTKLMQVIDELKKENADLKKELQSQSSLKDFGV
jgi:hypothetical protein